ncbi:MAG: hypothetical protein HZY75_07645 [Nocardioidaceae bacterium]|nr:MAG: hypothetical protein HZY75_07645 [Nocardioidaceae bacterium]
MTVTDDRRFWLSAVATVVVGLMVASMVAFATTPVRLPAKTLAPAQSPPSRR